MRPDRRPSAGDVDLPALLAQGAAELGLSLDEATLRFIAEAAGGTYRRMETVQGGLADVAAALKDPQSKPAAVFRKRLGIDRYRWPLAVAIFLLVAESLLRTRRRPAAQTS